MTTENTNASSVAQNFNAGDKLAGCYLLKEILPFDGPGVVWLAHDEELDRDLTLYFLPDTVVRDSQAMSEIKQETKHNRQIIHPHILRVHDLIEEENWAAITMDYVAGETLAALRKKRENGTFNVSEISAWVGQLCQTLEDAHKIDLLHRDFAPENLLVTGSGVTVMNFGISRAVLDSLSRSGQKVHGDGNLAYLSPQQLDGERPSRWDDIYSFGAVIYDLVTSRPPFHTGELISQIRKAVPPLMSERRQELGISGEAIPRAWDVAIASCLDKHTAQRPKNALELWAALNAEVPPAAAPLAGEIPAEPAGATGTPENPSESSLVSEKNAWGPGKTPLITEATVLSQTTVGKTTDTDPSAFSGVPADQAAAAAAILKEGEERRTGPTTPSGFPLRAFVGVEEGTATKKPKIPGAALAFAALILLVGIVAYSFSGSDKKETGFAPGVTQLENAQNVSSQQDIDEPVKSSGPAAVAAATASPTSAPVNKPEQTPTLVAKNEMAKPAPVNSTPAASPSGAPASPMISMAGVEPGSKLAVAIQAANEKAKAAAAAHQQLSELGQTPIEKGKSTPEAEKAVQEAQDALQQKTAAAGLAKKAADDAAAAQKQREEAQKKAEADADAAQKIAAEKAKLAADAKKAATDSVQAIKDQQAAAARTDAEIKTLQQTLTDKQHAAAEMAKANAAREAGRKQIETTVKQADADAAAALAEIERIRQADQARKAAEEAEKLRVAREAQLKHFSEQAAVAAKAAADAQKALQDAQRQFDEAQKTREKTAADAAAAANGVPLPETSKPMSSPPSASAMAPDTTLALASTQPPAKATLPVTNGIKLKVAQGLENSLGMKFASVGGVLFSVWQTRVQDFNAFAKATGFKSTAWLQPGFKQGPDHPVVNVSWNDAMAFCKWLTEKERKEGLISFTEAYRLPTDPEWSKAVGLSEENGRSAEARDMDVPDVYPWGTQWPPPAGAGNYTGEETGSDVAIKGYDDGFSWTSPVGSFRANKAGLFDLGGNVWQWCMDWWNDEHKHRVLRGGSWYNGALKLSLLSSCRVHAAPDSYTDNYGFRVVLGADTGKTGKR